MKTSKTGDIFLARPVPESDTGYDFVRFSILISKIRFVLVTFMTNDTLIVFKNVFFSDPSK